MAVYYRRHESPGCGGCLLITLLLLMLFGGAPMVVNFIGFLLFMGLAGILLFVGAFLGLTYFVRQRVSKYEQSQTETHNAFVTLLINILVKVAQVDGQITREESRTITNFFRSNLRYTQSQLLWAKEVIKDAIRSTVSLEELLSSFKQRFAYEPRLICLELVYQVIFSKQHVPTEEIDLAANIAAYLEISSYDHLAIRAKFMARAQKLKYSEKNYYEILGLQPGVPMDEVKKAYRKLSMQYHPDKVAHLGEEFKKVAEEKMKEINEAYQHIKSI